MKYLIICLFVLLACSCGDRKPIEESYRVATFHNAIGDTVYRVQQWDREPFERYRCWRDMRLTYFDKMEYATKEEAQNKVQSIIAEQITERDKEFHRIRND